MAEKRIGVAVTAPDSSAALAAIEDLEGRGFSAAWMTSGSASGGDSLSVFAAAAGRTQNIMLGTAITQIFPRHPIAVAQQVLVLAQLAPGRFRLGLGTSGRGGMEQTFGADFRAPLAHLREYLRIEKALLQQGTVDFSGRYYQAHSSIPSPVQVPVMAAALGPSAYQLCGAEADGAISWVCPGFYLRDVALPAMRSRAGRPPGASPGSSGAGMRPRQPRRGPRGGAPAVRWFRPLSLLPKYVHRGRISRSVPGCLERQYGRRCSCVGRREPGNRRTAGPVFHRGDGNTGLTSARWGRPRGVSRPNLGGFSQNSPIR